MEERDEKLEERLRETFKLDKQRTVVQDVAFPVRQLADIALKGLSPGINDPTTAENAMEALSALLIESIEPEPPPVVRTDDHGEPRLLAEAPELDDLIRLGFDQVRCFAGPYPLVTIRLIELLEQIEDAAGRAGVEAAEPRRQRSLIGSGVGEEGPTEHEVAEIRRRAGRRDLIAQASVEPEVQGPS